MSNNLYLFANNNEGTAENLGSYRLYNMKIDGDSEGVESGVDYVDCLVGDGNSWIDSGIVVRNGYTIDLTFASTIDRYNQEPICGSGDVVGYTYDRFGGYGIGLRSNCVAVREIRDEVNIDKNELETTTIAFAIDEKVNFSHKFTNVNNNGSCLVMGQNYCNNSNPASPLYKTSNTVKLYDFKIYNDSNTLLIHLKPCLDEEGIPCMYDEISGEYFKNLGTGTFGYKKELRNFQPVLDSNGIPTLMDKVNKKYYYDKNGKGFRYEESYKPVSYLQGDGSSWINTGIIPTTNTKVVVDTYMLLTDLNNGPALFGSTDTFLYFTLQTTKSWLYVGKINGKHSVGQAGYDFSGRRTITIDLSDMTNIVNIDGTNYGTFTGTQATDSKPIHLWNAFDSWGALVKSGSTAKIYSFKIYENNVLTMDLIPVLDNNNTPCMYDKVSKQFFYNQGDGEFSYGIEELECPKANYVEYIRGSRNAYINTLDISGMINSEVEVEWKFKLEGISKATGWFGTVGSYNGTPLYARNTYDAINVVFLEPSNNVTIKTEDRHLGVHVMKINKTGLYMDGNLEAELPGTTYYDSYSFVQPFALLGYNFWNGIQSRFWENVLYYVTIKQAGELILDFRPCLDEDGVLCVYEAVNGVYYYNSGTGEFGGHGKSIGYTPISYIESNGTQYIDTGVVPTDNTDIDMVAKAVTKEYTQVEYLQGDGASYIDTGMPITTGYDIECNYRHGIPTMTGGIFGLADKNNMGSSVHPKLRINYIPTPSSDFNYDNHCIAPQFTEVTKTEKGAIFSDCKFSNTKYNYYLFGTHAINGDPGTPCWMTDCFISMFKVWDTEGNLVQHLISVLDSEGTPCMYDLVNEQFHYNQGTGTFSYGNVTPSKNYLMNDFYTDTTYKYKEIDTTVEPNLTASEGATLTLGSTYMSYLSEEELEQATKNGWIIE